MRSLSIIPPWSRFIKYQLTNIKLREELCFCFVSILLRLLAEKDLVHQLNPAGVQSVLQTQLRLMTALLLVKQLLRDSEEGSR